MGVTPICIYHLECNRIVCTLRFLKNMAKIMSVHARFAVSIHFMYGEFILFVGLLLFAVMRYLGCVAEKKIGVSGFPDNKPARCKGW